jgi:hypothetical protein
MEGYIHEVTVFPDLTAVIALPEMISLVNQLLDVTTEDDVPFIFFYDTTFKLGKFLEIRDVSGLLSILMMSL